MSEEELNAARERGKEEYKKYNIHAIKDMIYEEIKKNRIYHKEIEQFDFKISLLDILYDSITNDDFDNNEISMGVCIGLCLPKTKENQKAIKEFYSCLYYINYCNTHKKYNKDALRNAKKTVKSFRDILYDEKQALEKGKDTVSKAASDDDVIEYHKILYNFENQILISPLQYDLLCDLIVKNNSEKRDQILFLDTIRTYNNLLTTKGKNKKVDYTKINDVRNILWLGYEAFQVPYVEKDKQNFLNSQVSSICKIANDPNIYLFNTMLNSFASHSFDEMSYILVQSLRQIQTMILENAKDIEEKEFYLDRNLRKEIVNNHKVLMEKYIILRDYYDNLVEEHNVEVEEEKAAEEISEEEENKIEVYYLFHGTGASLKSYIITDLKDLDKDTYSKVKYLIDHFKKDVLFKREKRDLGINNDNLKDLKELRNDQIRIFYRHLEGDKYLIVGVALKKCDNNLALCKKMANRNVADEFIKPASEVEEHLDEILTNDARIGGRTNGKRSD